MKTKYQRLFNRVKKSYKYWAEVFTLEFIGDISDLMAKKKVSQKALAKKLNISEAYISKVLNGYENLSINSISKIAFALDATPHIHVAPIGKFVEWKERSSGDARVEISLGESWQNSSGFSVWTVLDNSGKNINRGVFPDSLESTFNEWKIKNQQDRADVSMTETMHAELVN